MKNAETTNNLVETTNSFTETTKNANQTTNDFTQATITSIQTTNESIKEIKNAEAHLHRASAFHYIFKNLAL